MQGKEMLASTERQGSHEEESPVEAEEGEFGASVSGLPLNAEWVKKARREAMQ